MRHLVLALVPLVSFPVSPLAQASPGCTSGPGGSAAAVTSARMSALAREVATNGARAIDAFWRGVAASGTPLIERADSGAPCVAVTFLHRDGGADAITLVGGFSGWLDSLSRLDRIPDTDLWHRTLLLPADIRTGYQFRVTRAGTGSNTGGTSSPRLVLDSLNPRVDSILGRRSLLVGPGAPSSAWLDARSGVDRGQVETVKLSMTGRDTSLTAWVYTPPHYDGTRSDTLPLLVLFDGGAYVAAGMVGTPTILDNLIAERRIAPVIALFLPQETTPAARQAIMGNNAAYMKFVAEKAIPWVQSRYRASRDPARVVVGGSSLGGLASSYLALLYPSVVRNVLSQSGSYQWPHASDSEPEWLTRQFASSPGAPIRFYVEAGRFETGGPRGLSLLTSNRHFRDVLQAKGYVVTYREVAGGHEYLSWRTTLTEPLQLFFPTDSGHR